MVSELKSLDDLNIFLASNLYIVCLEVLNRHSFTTFYTRCCSFVCWSISKAIAHYILVRFWRYSVMICIGEFIICHSLAVEGLEAIWLVYSLSMMKWDVFSDFLQSTVQKVFLIFSWGSLILLGLGLGSFSKWELCSQGKDHYLLASSKPHVLSDWILSCTLSWYYLIVAGCSFYTISSFPTIGDMSLIWVWLLLKIWASTAPLGYCIC